METKIITVNTVKDNSCVNLGFVCSPKGKMNIVVSFMLMLFVGTVFFSCDNSEDPIPLSPKEQAISVNRDHQETRARAFAEWIYVDDQYKQGYFSAHQAASQSSFRNVENCFLSVGFFLVINTVNSFSLTDLGQYSLDELARYNSSYAWFGDINNQAYSNERSFKKDIKAFVSSYRRPVVVAARTNVQWSRKRMQSNLLTVWAVSEAGVQVTRISDRPPRDFSNSSLFELTWDEFFKKSCGFGIWVANVVYPYGGNPH